MVGAVILVSYDSMDSHGGQVGSAESCAEPRVADVACQFASRVLLQ
jgi:hypothetical protein